MSNNNQARAVALTIQKQLVAKDVSVFCHLGDSSFKNQFKKADKSGAKVAVIIGEDELKHDAVGLKTLVSAQKSEQQQTINKNEVIDVVTNLLKRL